MMFKKILILILLSTTLSANLNEEIKKECMFQVTKKGKSTVGTLIYMYGIMQGIVYKTHKKNRNTQMIINHNKTIYLACSKALKQKDSKSFRNDFMNGLSSVVDNTK